MSVCTSITAVGKVNGTDVLKVIIDNEISAYWFFNYADSLAYVGKEVIVDYRKDVYNGELVDFINTFIIPNTVHTLDKEDNIKLYIDQEDNFSNISFSDIADSETRGGCIVFCTAQEFKSSTKAVWMECIIRDRSMHTAVLRLFDYENASADFAGKYIVTELTRSKYGFTTDFIGPVDGKCPPNPEIELGKKFILNYFKDDAVSLDYINKTNVLEFLEELVDYEKGYGLMRLAMELAMVDSMGNITKDVDLSAIGRALLAKRGHISRNSVLSECYNNLALANKFMWDNRKLVMQLLDVNIDEHPKEYVIMNNIVNTVSGILEVRKGTVF